MSDLSFPFTVNQAAAYLKKVGEPILGWSGPPGLKIDHFEALEDLGGGSGGAASFRRDSREVPGEAALIIQHEEVPFIPGASHIWCSNPHRAFFKLVRGVYPKDPEHGVDWRGARIDQSNYYQTDFHSVFRNTSIYSELNIGHASSIGGAGFGFVFEDDQTSWRVPHLGRVILHDRVEIGSNTCIDRGCLGDTVIGEATKIDNLVHIAHNVKIGKNCHIVAHACIAGSAKIGSGTWVGPHAVIRNGITVGKNCLIGMGAVVTKDVPDGWTVAGVPAKRMR